MRHDVERCLVELGGVETPARARRSGARIKGTHHPFIRTPRVWVTAVRFASVLDDRVIVLVVLPLDQP